MMIIYAKLFSNPIMQDKVIWTRLYTNAHTQTEVNSIGLFLVGGGGGGGFFWEEGGIKT